jgi:hypothetical protein
MKVVFETMESSGERGFKANFNGEELRFCGGDLTVTLA